MQRDSGLDAARIPAAATGSRAQLPQTLEWGRPVKILRKTLQAGETARPIKVC